MEGGLSDQPVPERALELGVPADLADQAPAEQERQVFLDTFAFDHALQIDADYGEALWYKGTVLAEAKQDDAGAVAAWERFVRVSAPGPEREQAVSRIREAKARLAGSPGARPGGGPPGRRPGGPGARPAEPARP